MAASPSTSTFPPSPSQLLQHRLPSPISVDPPNSITAEDEIQFQPQIIPPTEQVDINDNDSTITIIPDQSNNADQTAEHSDAPIDPTSSTPAVASSSKTSIAGGDGGVAGGDVASGDGVAAGDGIPKVNGARKGKGSCVYCRKRKQRCDPGPTPSDQCWPCKRLNKECVYPPGGIHTPRQSTSSANKLDKTDIVDGTSGGGIGGSGSGKKPNSIKLTFSGSGGPPGKTSPSSSSNIKHLSSPPMNHDVPPTYIGSIGYPPQTGHMGIFHPHTMSYNALGGGHPVLEGMRDVVRNGISTSIGRKNDDEGVRRNKDKKARRDVDFTSDEESDDQGGDRKGKRKGEFSSDEQEGVMRTELGGTASQGDANAQEPTIGRNGTEASSDLTSQASADGVGPAENGEDDDSMEAVDEDSARVRTQNVTAEQDDEIDELMEELDQPENGKNPKVRGEDGKGELEEEVEGELLMLADAEAPKRKRSRGASPHQRLSTSAMHPFQTQWPSPVSGGSRPVVSRHSMANGHGGSSRNRHGSVVGFHGGPSPNGMMPGQGVLPMGHSNGFIPFPHMDILPSFENMTPYANALHAIFPVLPPPATQQILFQTFFQDHFLAQGLTLLQPQYNNDFRDLIHRRSKVPPAPFRAGDATTLAVGLAILAVSLRIMPDETSQILLSSVVQTSNPRSLSRVLNGQSASLSDPTPLHRRYIDHALLASQVSDFEDPPSVMQVFLKLLLYRYGRLCAGSPTVDPVTSQPRPPQLRDRLVLTGGWLAQGIKTAQAMGMNREWDGIPAVERELRRRVFWALYVADRGHAFSTSFPYVISDHHTTVAMPSPMSEVDLYCLPANIRQLPDHSTDENPTSCTHLFVIAHLARLMTKLLDSFAINTPAGTSNELVTQYDASLMQFEEALPDYFKFSPFTDTSRDTRDPFVPSHRVHIHSSIMNVRLSLHRPRLSQYLSPTGPSATRQHIADTCLGTIRIHRNARMLESRLSFRLFDVERVFESAVTLGLIGRVEKLLTMERKAATGSPKPPAGFSAEAILNARGGLAEGIELLEGVQGWVDHSYLAGKALRVLRRLAVKNDGLRIGEGAAEAITAWLKTWRGTNVDMLMAEAEWRDWERVVEGI